MKRIVLMVFVLAVGIIVITLIAGCEEGQVPSGKKARLISAENMQLKQQLQQREIEIEKLKGTHRKELENQKGLIERCQREKKLLQEKLSGKFEGQLNEFLKGMGEEARKLREENESLKLQIEQLKAELEKNVVPM